MTPALHPMPVVMQETQMVEGMTVTAVRVRMATPTAL